MSRSSEWMHDRFTVCLILAAGLHAAVVFGVTFGVDLNPAPKLVETLEVVLVNWRSEEAPEEPDYLAQAAQRGGGEDDEKTRPSQPTSGLLPTTNPGEDFMQAEEAIPEPQPMARETIMVESTSGANPQMNLNESPDFEPTTAARLMRESMQMANLEPELSRHAEWRSKLPRRKYISSANTQEYEFASYMSAWVAKVERVGNLNYPARLREKRLHGDLVLTVGIRHDGSVESIDLPRSSGNQEIDRAAMEIVRLASPYAPLPDNIREKVDVLHITRTWRFESAIGVH